MKHFNSDESRSALEDYEMNIGGPHYELSDSLKDYEMNIGGPHYEPDADDWYEGTKHFSD